MKKLKFNIGLTALAALALFSCQDDVDAPGMQTPVATIQANTSIADLKAAYWDDEANYIDTIKLTADGNHVVIAGRVISSDAAGNIYKSLVIQDGTGALALSINKNSLYNEYRVGQEVVIDVTDMYIGKYSGLQQLGFPEYSAGYGWQATFMPYEFFAQHAQLNGVPEPEKIDTVLVRSYSDLSTSAEGLRKWQSQLVRFNNCHFELGGQASFTDAHKENANRNLILEDGNQIIVRNSGYATFWGTQLPAGNGDVVGILSYFGSSGWQLLLRSVSDCMNFGNPTLNPGAEDNPYTVPEVIAIEREGVTASGWVTGFIAGAVAPEVTEVTSSDDIEWGSDVTLANTLVIAPSMDVKDIDKCLILPLPQGSALRQYGALTTNPTNYGKQIWVDANSMNKYLGSWGIETLSGAASQFKIEGVTIGGGGEEPSDGDGSKEKPYSPAQVIALNNPGTVGVWAEGYIVGWGKNSANYTLDATFSATGAPASNVLIAATPGETDPAKCVPVEIPSGTPVRAAVNLKDNPGNISKFLKIQGTLNKYFGQPGVRACTEWELTGEGTGGGDEPGPGPSGDAIDVTSPDFNTLNDGQSSGKYISSTSKDGWKTVECAILRGGDADDTQNGVLTFFGSPSTFAVCLNGRVGRVGSLTSPLISGGIKTLKFKYALPFTDTKCKLTINIKQNDAVVATTTLDNASMTKLTVYDFSWDANVTGDFVLEIINDCPSNSSTANKDRTAIWDMSWTR